KALRESQQYNRLLFESLPIGLVLCRMDGAIVDFNSAFARIIGRAAEQVREMSCWDLTPPECVAPEQRLLQSLQRTGRTGPYEKEFIHQDGHRVPVRTSGMILERGGECFVWSSVEDITEQKTAEEELRASNKKYRSLFDTSRDGIKFTTLDGEIEEANQAYLDMIGYSLDELRRVQYRKLTPLRWWPIESDIIANQVMRRGYSDEYEKEYIRRDGTVFPVQVRLWLVRDEHGKPARFFGIFRDITERKRHEQATRHRQAQLAHVARLSTVGEMAAGLAHELNQPLSALTNYAHGCLRRLQAGKADQEMLTTALEHITVQAARASEIIRRVRSFVGKDDQRRADTDVNELVHHGVDMVDLDLRRHAVSIELELADDLPRPHVDAVQIEQVIINLLLNGIEAMRQARTEQPKFHVRTTLEGGAVSMTIADNGPGIDPAVVDQIFDPFFTTKERGMGMGLSICRSIIEQHGGRLWAEQAPAGGAVFTFLLPVSEGGQANGI
ncbi:MAG TPA: PAS domain S-box protein, partial [Phycisphaerae bacterium]|nr:PAS domain S-box protein [Phycisphaerae bacterium]